MFFEAFTIISFMFVTILIFISYYFINTVDRKYQIAILEAEHQAAMRNHEYWSDHMELRQEIEKIKGRGLK